tara:strand:- start:396 stop:608 length:213 start_codon:yes stop_codon:yes gene_type:complete
MRALRQFIRGLTISGIDNVSVCYEQLCSQPAAQLSKLLTSLELPVDRVSELSTLISPDKPERWRSYAPHR